MIFFLTNTSIVRDKISDLQFYNSTMRKEILDQIIETIQKNDMPIRLNMNANMKDIIPYYNYTLKEAALHLNTCDSVLKKIMRKNGIERWPHRKLRSINNIIQYEESKNNMKAKLEFELIRNKIIENPNAKMSDFIPKSKLNMYNNNIRNEKNRNTMSINQMKNMVTSRELPIPQIKNVIDMEIDSHKTPMSKINPIEIDLFKRPVSSTKNMDLHGKPKSYINLDEMKSREMPQMMNMVEPKSRERKMPQIMDMVESKYNKIKTNINFTVNMQMSNTVDIQISSTMNLNSSNDQIIMDAAKILISLNNN